MIVFTAQLNQTIGDVEGNCKKILDALARARAKKVDIVVFPELALSGYPPEDLLLDEGFIARCEGALQIIEKETDNLFVAVGTPRRNPSGKEKSLFNSAALFQDGKLLGFKDKNLLPTYDVFDERRYFEPGIEEASVWEYKGKKIGIAICEDLWQHSGLVGYTDYRYDPVVPLKKAGVDLVLNLSASPYYFGKKTRRSEVFSDVAVTLNAPVVFCNQVGANDQLIFDGSSFCLNGKGELIGMAKSFQEDDFVFDLSAKHSVCKIEGDPIPDLYHALVLGVRDYFQKQGFKKAILGLSGGIDSALVACIAAEALGVKNILALALPSRYSSKESLEDATHLAKNLHIDLKKVEIESVHREYLSLLEPFFEGRREDVTEENLQSRIRGQILMAFSNKLGHLLLNTGNKSELAMGYTTLYGDMCGGLGVILDVTKTKVYALARYVNREKKIIPERILTKAPSAELKVGQTDQDTLPPYEVLDGVLEDYVERRISPEEIAKRRNLTVPFVREIMGKIHLAEYKRRQAPLGLRVTPKSFSKGRNVPVVQKWIRH